MSEVEYAALRHDIAANGQCEPVWTWNGLLIDGRHRARACDELGIECKSRSFEGPETSLLAFVVSLNLKRRHLTASQLAFVALGIEQIESRLARQRMVAGGGDKRPGVEQIPHPVEDSGRARDKAASAVGVNPRYVSDAKRIDADAPALAVEIKAGRKTIAQAKREMKEAKRAVRRAANRDLVGRAPDPIHVVDAARFSTIVIDPPWDWGDEGDQDQLGRARPTYGTMPFDELLDLPVPDLVDDDCHLYLWITNRSLPKGFALLERWGFRYVTTLTWCKPSFGMGNYFRGSTEHVLFGVKGSQSLKRKDVGTWFAAPRGPDGHSSKPPAFAELVESCSPGPYLEMFARSGRADWTSWGAEAHAQAA